MACTSSFLKLSRKSNNSKKNRNMSWGIEVHSTSLRVVDRAETIKEASILNLLKTPREETQTIAILTHNCFKLSLIWQEDPLLRFLILLKPENPHMLLYLQVDSHRISILTGLNMIDKSLKEGKKRYRLLKTSCRRCWLQHKIINNHPT